MKNWLRVLILCCVCVLISLTLVACQTTVNAFKSNESQKGTTVQDPIDNENTLPQEPNAPEVIEPIEPPVVELPCTHTYDNWVILKEPNCTEPGLQQRNCQNCEEFEQEILSAKGHSYQVISTEPATCTQAGTQVFECENCSDFKTEVINATDHQYSITIIKPDCINQGYTHHVCHCGDEYTDNEVPATGHSFNGTNQCTNCGFTEMPKLSPIDNMNDSYWFVTGKSKAYVIYFETSNGKNGTYMAYSAETNEDKTFKCVTQTSYNYNGTFEIIQNNGTYNIKFFDKWLDESDSQGDYAKYTLTYSANNETFTLNGSFMNVNSTWIFVGYGLL